MKRPISLTLLLIVLSILSACGPSPGEQADPGDSPPVTAEDDPTATPRDTPQPDDPPRD